VSRPQRLLITGAAGFVGSAVVRIAVSRGLHTTAAVSPASRLDRLAPLGAACTVVRADVTDGESMAALVASARPDVCIHLAAAGAVTRSEDLATLLQANAVAPGALARLLAAGGCRRLVTAGSSSEYGSVCGPMDESVVCEPDDAYGVSKLAGGLLARCVGRELGLETAHLRLFSVYGPGEDPRRLVPSVIRGLLAGQPVPLTSGRQVRDFVYVDDAADALLAAALAPQINGLTANIGSGVETTVRDLCLKIADVTGGHHLLRFGAHPYRDGERFAWRAATDRAQRELGWSACTPLAEGLARTIELQRRASTTLSGPPADHGHGAPRLRAPRSDR
jgi:dolichol-phosphate mannosyltransferase